MATIRKRTSREGTHYHVQIRLKGYPQQTATFLKKRDAQLWAQQTPFGAEESLRE